MSTIIKITARGEHIESFQIKASDLSSLKTQGDFLMEFIISNLKSFYLNS